MPISTAVMEGSSVSSCRAGARPGVVSSMRSRCSTTSPISAMRAAWRSIRRRRPTRSSRPRSSCRPGSTKIMSDCQSGSSMKRISSPIFRRRSTPPEPAVAGAVEPVTPSEAILSLPWPIDLELTVAIHGWAHLAPWSWDPKAGRLGRRERIGNQCGTIALTQGDPDSMVLRWDGFAPAVLPEIHRRARRWLSADWQPASAMAALCEDRALIAQGGGRLLRGSSFYEDFVKTVLTINTNWSATCRMAVALVREPGGGSFPGPLALVDYGEERLRERAKLGFRAPTLISATCRMLYDEVITAAGEGSAEQLEHDY